MPHTKEADLEEKFDNFTSSKDYAGKQQFRHEIASKFATIHGLTVRRKKNGKSVLA